MNKQKKAEWKGMFKGVVVTLLLLGVFSAGVVYAAVTLMTDEGFFVGDTSMTDGKVTINSTEITDDSFGDAVFFTHSFTDEKSYGVSSLVDNEGKILEIYKEYSFTPTGRYFAIPDAYMTGYYKTDDVYDQVRVGIQFGLFDTQRSVGDDPWTGQFGDYLYGYGASTTYLAGYGQEFGSYMGSGAGHYLTPGHTYYVYLYSFVYTNSDVGTNATTAYITNVTCGAIMF